MRRFPKGKRFPGRWTSSAKNMNRGTSRSRMRRVKLWVCISWVLWRNNCSNQHRTKPFVQLRNEKNHEIKRSNCFGLQLAFGAHIDAGCDRGFEHETSRTPVILDGVRECSG